MYRLVQEVGVREAVVREAPPMVIALVTAELFYKFRSFTLECVAFLATWAALSVLFGFVTKRLRRVLRTS